MVRYESKETTQHSPIPPTKWIAQCFCLEWGYLGLAITDLICIDFEGICDKLSHTIDSGKDAVIEHQQIK